MISRGGKRGVFSRCRQEALTGEDAGNPALGIAKNGGDVVLLKGGSWMEGRGPGRAAGEVDTIEEESVEVNIERKGGAEALHDVDCTGVYAVTLGQVIEAGLTLVECCDRA